MTLMRIREISACSEHPRVTIVLEDVNWLEAQRHQIQEVGYENYLAQQIHD